jgi:inhibitor of cysteine peptidase
MNSNLRVVNAGCQLIAMGQVIVDAETADRPHHADIGDLLVIRLAETPTSGFRWQLDQYDPRVLEFEDDPFIPSEDAQVGGGGVREFRFVVRRGVCTDLLLTLRRSGTLGVPASSVLHTTLNGA